LVAVVQRKAQTQTESYWRRDFKVRPEDIEAIYDMMLEDARPRTLDELACEVMARHIRREAQARQPGETVPYQPKEHYAVGQRLFFPHRASTTGTVVAERPGRNPRYGDFTVISVALEGEEQPREFAADYGLPHPLCGIRVHQQINDLFRVIDQVRRISRTQLFPRPESISYSDRILKWDFVFPLSPHTNKYNDDNQRKV